uniref:diguanylate cyclase n=1 Tax=Candidatus Nitrotoga fabula TaxID=2182327 RepID=A0A2X0QUI4_9PROT|nr:putative PAS/PAC sensor protein [Candidatus Nitrotoga fabula]
MLDISVYMEAVMQSSSGIAIADMRADDFPLVFVNPAFERMTGYPASEAIGRNCRYLQHPEFNQPERTLLRQAIQLKQACTVRIKNFRKSGEMFWNQLQISPVFDSRHVLAYYIGVQTDISAQVRLEQLLLEEKHRLEAVNAELEVRAGRDSLTNLHNRRALDEKLEAYVATAKNSGISVNMFFIDVDFFKKYNDTYGHQAGDQALRLVADALQQLCQRPADFVARYGGEEMAFVSLGMSSSEIQNLAGSLCQKIRSLNIPHVHGVNGNLTISVGCASIFPAESGDQETLVTKSDQAVYRAKAAGRNRWFYSE